MTTTEIRKKIAESPEKDWFNSVEITIRYPHIEFEESFKGLSSIHRFLSKQENGWKEYSSIPNVLNSSKQHFTNLKIRIENFVNLYYSHNEVQLNNIWRTEQSQLQSNNNYFTFDSVYTKFLIDLSERLPNSANGAFNYLIRKNNNLNDINTFIGSLLAYEFELKDKTGITERRKKERASLSKLKTDFKNQLSDTERDLVNHLKRIDNLKNEKEQLFTDWFEGNEENKIIGVKTEFDNFKSNKESIFNDWFDGTEKELGAKKKVSDLEHTYEELLRLKKPAEYWKTRATDLKKEGWQAIHWLIGIVAFACVTLYLLLWLTPEGMLLSFIKGNAQAIKWSVVYITFISFLAFGIRALNKVAFSSFHLARDAEEREQLTYVYLALIKDNAVDEKDKNLIMQSLFSRADTGLLKDDSGPTMPNDIAGKIFGGK
ncbi:DUF6161 domain-containing protein [uncultured Tenacibaculum sp.]|uniref:DUF6161 domain-containing protein n=1 Tax=uncultured Tenacibaculum sp. TaxID=174713 RepID=UPI002621B74F|nr:DUF6161 domain-containing protein [uncultured Tenacibaculum sp.]